MKTPQGTKLVRRITVYSQTFSRESRPTAIRFPKLHLCGKWLQDTGFKIGQVVDIACETGKLIITIAQKQKYPDKQ